MGRLVVGSVEASGGELGEGGSVDVWGGVS